VTLNRIILSDCKFLKSVLTIVPLEKTGEKRFPFAHNGAAS